MRRFEPPEMSTVDRAVICERLWYADWREGWACVNGPDQECLLVLFTSSSGPGEYFVSADAPGADLPLALVFSEDENEFLRLAQDALLEGVDGALIVADGDETAGMIVRFNAAEAHTGRCGEASEARAELPSA